QRGRTHPLTRAEGGGEALEGKQDQAVEHQGGEHVDEAFRAQQSGYQRNRDQYVDRPGRREPQARGAAEPVVDEQGHYGEAGQYRAEIGQQQHRRHTDTQIGAGDPCEQNCRHEELEGNAGQPRRRLIGQPATPTQQITEHDQTEDRYDRLKHYHAAAPRNKGGGRCIRAKGRKNTPLSQNSAKPNGPVMRMPRSRTMNFDQDSEFALRGTARAASTEARSRCQSGAASPNVSSKRRQSSTDHAG